jgi:hypothetical protein
MTLTDTASERSGAQDLDAMRVTDAEVAHAQVAEPTQVDARDERRSAQVLPADAPSEEHPPVDPALFERARDAVSALRGAGRRQNGQAGAGNMLALRTGLRSSQLLNAPDVAAWHAEQVAAITVDLGGEAELSALARASVREVARLEVILAALGEDLLRTGVLTGKGKSRSATTVYLHVLDRFTRLSQALGLARQPKAVQRASDLMAEGRAR